MCAGTLRGKPAKNYGICRVCLEQHVTRLPNCVREARNLSDSQRAEVERPAALPRPPRVRRLSRAREAGM